MAARKKVWTKCEFCKEPPAYLVSSARIKDRPVCLEHARPYVLSMFWTMVALYEVPPRIAKAAARKAAK